MTDEQRERKNECARENSRWKKERQLCVRCGKQDAYTLVGRSYCYECCEYDRECRRSDTVLKNNKTKQREKYRKNVESGICPTCGKRRAEYGYINCPVCRAKKARRQLEYNHKNGVLPRCLLDGTDRCARCGKEEVVMGYKLCGRCLENSRKAIKKALDTPREQNYFEKSIINNFKYWSKVYGTDKIEGQG